MSRRCELTGVNRQIGHKVSHSNIKTKREFKPNLVDVTLTSDALGQRLQAAHHGGGAALGRPSRRPRRSSC